MIYACDTKKCKILIFSPEGELVKEIGHKGEDVGGLLLPQDVGSDRMGKIYALDNKKMKIFDSLGTEMESFTSKGAPWRFCIRDTNGIYVLATIPVNGKIILKYNHTGKLLGEYVETQKEKNPFIQMLLNQGSIVNDNKGNIYVAFTNEYRIIKIDKNGQIDNSYITKQMPYKIIKPHKRKEPKENVRYKVKVLFTNMKYQKPLLNKPEFFEKLESFMLARKCEIPETQNHK